VSRSAAGAVVKVARVEDSALSLADFLESIASCDLARGDVVGIGEDLKTVEIALRRRDFARQGNRPDCNTTTAVSRIRPIGKVGSSVPKRSEFTASEEFAAGDASHCKCKPHPSEALSFPSSDNVLGVLERGNKVIGKVKASAVLGVAVGFGHERGVSRLEKREKDDAIAQAWESGNIHDNQCACPANHTFAFKGLKARGEFSYAPGETGLEGVADGRGKWI
jgi:hypothetical protein